MAEEEQEKVEEGAEVEEEAEASGGRSWTRLILIVGAAVLILAGAGAGFVMLGGLGEEEETAEAAEGAEPDEAEETEPEEPPHPFEVADRKASRHVSASKKHEPPPSASQMVGTIYALDTFVVNIGDRNRDRYLKLKAELELSNESVVDEVEQRLPQIRDLVISLLGSKSFEEVRSIEGKDLLREEVLLRINALLVTGKARRVFFTEFVVQ